MKELKNLDAGLCERLVKLLYTGPSCLSRLALVTECEGSAQGSLSIRFMQKDSPRRYDLGETLLTVDFVKKKAVIYSQRSYDQEVGCIDLIKYLQEAGYALHGSVIEKPRFQQGQFSLA